MSPIELAFLNRLQNRAARMRPDLAKRLLEAYRLVAQSLSERELVAAIRSGQIDRLILELVDGESLDPAFVKLRARLNRILMDSARLEAERALPSFLRPAAFNVLSPHVVQAARTLSTRVIQGLKQEIQLTVMQHVEEGLREGLGPRTVARGVRDVIGLAPNQEAAVRNFRRMLESGDPTALRRALRDRRYDPLLRRALGRAGTGLTPEQIDRQVRAYRRRALAWNAETHARTMALDANKLGQRLSWQDAIDRGVVSRDQLTRQWIAVGGPAGDGRNRPEHLALHGTEVGFDEPFPNGELVPGDSTYNCRCIDRTIIKRAAVEVAA